MKDRGMDERFVQEDKTNAFLVGLSIIFQYFVYITAYAEDTIENDGVFFYNGQVRVENLSIAKTERCFWGGSWRIYSQKS